MKSEMLESAKAYFQGNLRKHSMNVRIMLEKPTAVAEHPDMMETLEGELDKVVHYEDLLKALSRFE